MPFPTWVSSPVPELLKDGPVIDFGKFGRDLVIVEPNQISATRDGAALKGMLGLIAKKVPNALTLPAEKVDAAQRSHQLLVVGTLQGNPVAREVLGAQADTFLQGIPPGRVSPQGRGQSLCPRA